MLPVHSTRTSLASLSETPGKPSSGSMVSSDSSMFENLSVHLAASGPGIVLKDSKGEPQFTVAHEKDPAGDSVGPSYTARGALDAPMEVETTTAQAPVRTDAHPPETGPTLGKLDAGLSRALHEVAATFSGKHSATGSEPLPKEAWSKEQVDEYAHSGKWPEGAPNSVDFAKAVFTRFAQELGKDDPDGVKRFLTQLSNARVPQDIEDLVPAHFSAGTDGVMTFAAPAAAPAKASDLTKSANYAKFLEASGMKPAAFDRLCGELSAKGLIFGEVFSGSEHARWGTAFFQQLGAQLQTCKPGEAAVAVLYHPDCYSAEEENGTGITHVSALAVTPEGELCVNHHESVLVLKRDKKAEKEGVPRDPRTNPVRNYMPSSVGVPASTYETGPIFERMNRQRLAPAPDVLPVMQSFQRWGGPTAMMTKVADFSAFKEHTDKEAERGASGLARSMDYAADPDPDLDKAFTAYRDDKNHDKLSAKLKASPRWASQTLVAPPTQDGAKSAPNYSNSCYLKLVVALEAGKCPALEGRPKVKASHTTDMTLGTLLHAGLLPDTPLDHPERIRRENKQRPDGSVDISTRSFLQAVSSQYGYAQHPGSGYAAHVPGEWTLAKYKELGIEPSEVGKAPTPKLQAKL